MMMCSKAELKCTVTTPVIKKVNHVEYMRQTANNNKRNEFFRSVTFRNVTFRLQLKQIPQRKVLSKFIAETNESHIGLGVSTALHGHTPTSTLQSLLDLGPNRTDSNHVDMTTNCQRDATFAHRCKVSRIQRADIFTRIRRHRKSWRGMEPGTANTRSRGGEHGKRTRNVTGKAEEKRNDLKKC